MAAFLYTNQNKKDIFLSNVTFNSPVATAFDGMTNELGLVTSVGMQIQESIQYFLTFDDIINYLHLGKGVGNISIEGIAYPNCAYTFPALRTFFSIVSANRGQIMKTSFIGGGAFSGPLIAASSVAQGGDGTIVSFAAQIAITSHSLGSKKAGGGKC